MEKLAKKVFAEQIQFGPRLHRHVPHHLGLARKPHRLLVPDKGDAGQGIKSTRRNRRWHRDAESGLFAKSHFARVIGPFDNVHPTGATLSETLAIRELIDRRPKTIHALVYVDTRLKRFTSQISTDGNFNFFFLFDEFDDRHEWIRTAGVAKKLVRNEETLDKLQDILPFASLRE